LWISKNYIGKFQKQRLTKTIIFADKIATTTSSTITSTTTTAATKTQKHYNHQTSKKTILQNINST